MATAHNSLRQRKTITKESVSIDTNINDAETHSSTATAHEEVVWGKTPGGEGESFIARKVILPLTHAPLVFRIPTTHDVLTTLFHPKYPKSHLDLLNLGSLALQIILFLILPRHSSRVLFFFYFAFWRAAYDAGLGYVLTQQSKQKWIVKVVKRLGWLDEQRCPRIRNWIRDQLAGKMGKDYSFDVCIPSS
jgi:phosphatidylethanolamine N-methyltransferase